MTFCRDMDRTALAAALPGYVVRLEDEVDSTQRVAGAWVAGQDAPPGPAMVVSLRQTSGRGRGVKRWVSDPGCVTVTFILPAPQGPSPLELPLRTGLVVRQTLARWTDESQVRIKWPNDVLIVGRKIAGILCHREHGRDLIGIGLNVHLHRDQWDDALAGQAASLHEHLFPGLPGELPGALPGAPGRQDVLIELARQMTRLWADPDWCDKLNAVHALTGQDIVVHTADGPIAGVCQGVDEQGRLLLQTGQTLHRLLDGTIQKPAR